MLFKVVFFPDEILDLSQSIRVDMVALPDKIDQAELPPDMSAPAKENPPPVTEEKTPDPVIAEPTPEPKPEPLPEKKEKVDEEAIKLEKKKKAAELAKKEEKKIKDKQKEALKKLKALSAIDKIKNEVKRENEEKAQTAAENARRAYKGRVLSAGTSPTGLDKIQSDSYLSQLDAKIKAHWALPQWLIGKSLRTRVLVKFDHRGQLLSKRITQSSGQPTYDEYCLQAIERAAPFPAVPEKFSEIYKSDGVTIGFPD